jgi:hypothetical protein
MSFDATVILEKLKLTAKHLRKQEPERSQSMALDFIAQKLSYNNWSMLHKDLASKEEDSLLAFHERLYRNTTLENLLPDEFAHINRESAIDEMRQWVEKTFTRLIEFAFYDRESENGFAWPSVDLNDELSEQFGRLYPYDLIDEVATDMELDSGPWGLEEYGADDE